MKAIIGWLMNPENNPIMFAVAIFIVLGCIVVSVLRAG